MSGRADAIGAIDEAVERIGAGLAARVNVGGRLSREALDQNQPAAFTFARSLAEREAVRGIDRWARRVGGVLEAGLADVYVAGVVRELAQRIRFGASALGVESTAAADLEALSSWVDAALASDRLSELAAMVTDRGSDIGGAYGLSSDHAEYRELFARFADDRVAPLAEHIHRHDGILPEPLIAELAELGVFGISIPSEFGGAFVDHLTMCIATEELSRASLGAGGSVITRPEIGSKAILKGGTPEQKSKWLPAIAAGERLISVAVTEPNAGSDVAGVRVTAKPTEGGWLINGEKTWCTFAGRADVFVLLARTGAPDSGARGLTLFLVEKPAHISETDHHSFRHQQPGGGVVEGHAIPTIGYRGMHSFSVTFEDYFVPAENRVGAEGQGFALQMEGFAGGRIQTAARAVGVMEAAFRAACTYVRDRKVFGEPLVSYALPKAKIAQMAATIQASRQLSYHVAGLMDDGGGGLEASLVKLLACRDAEQVTREAMQLHGGMGYSEEYAVSRYWLDARVLSIFEGAEEILAVYVVARAALRERIEGAA
ncbi:MAG: acyl-CoA dehydrogenase family protein [Myxococcales bacterium]|nr:acyl-CoA dehydrogenase family protein [Myxococcales bacterium]